MNQLQVSASQVKLVQMLAPGSRFSRQGAGKKGKLQAVWPEFVYHWSIVKGDNTADAKVVALDAINNGLFGRGLFLEGQVAAEVLDAYRAAEDERVKSRLMYLLAAYGIKGREVQRGFSKAFLSDGTPAAVLERGLWGFRNFICKEGVVFHDANEMLLPALKRALSHPDEDVLKEAVRVFQAMLGMGFVRKKTVYEMIASHRSILNQDRGLVKKLRELTGSPNRWIRTNALKVVERLELIDGDDGQRPPKTSFAKLIAEEREQRPQTAALSYGEMAQLLGAIRENGVLPYDLIKGLFEEGNQIVFLGYAASAGLPPLSVDEVLRLRDEIGLTHIALPVPRSQEKRLQRFIQGKLGFLSFGYNLIIGGTPCDDKATKEEARFMRRLLQQLKGKVELILYGDSIKENHRGELRIAAEASSIVRVASENRRARILVLGECINLAKTDLVEHQDGIELSIPAYTRERITGRTTCVVYMDEGNWERNSGLGGHNLIDFSEDFPIPHRFGMMVEGSPIARLNFDTDFKNTFSAAWDGLIFRKAGDGGDDFWGKPEVPPDPDTGISREGDSPEIIGVGAKGSLAETIGCQRQTRASLLAPGSRFGEDDLRNATRQIFDWADPDNLRINTEVLTYAIRMIAKRHFGDRVKLEPVGTAWFARDRNGCVRLRDIKDIDFFILIRDLPPEEGTWWRSKSEEIRAAILDELWQAFQEASPAHRLQIRKIGKYLLGQLIQFEIVVREESDLDHAVYVARRHWERKHSRMPRLAKLEGLSYRISP